MSNIDPSAVKAGDTVTLERDTALARDIVERIDPYPQGGFSIVLRETTPAYLTVTGWIVTDHQPAPEPEPEWKPGTTGTATINNVPDARVLRAGAEGVMTWWVAQDGCKYPDGEVTDFAPDEPRPLPTRDDLARIMHDDYLPNGMPRLGRTAREELAAAVLRFLRGEVR